MFAACERLDDTSLIAVHQFVALSEFAALLGVEERRRAPRDHECPQLVGRDVKRDHLQQCFLSVQDKKTNSE